MPMKMAAAKKRQPFLMQSNYPALAVILEVNHMGINSVFLIKARLVCPVQQQRRLKEQQFCLPRQRYAFGG